MWNLRNKRNDQRERGGGETEGGRERELMKQTLNYREQTEGYQREGGLGGERVKQVMGIKEGPCDEHQVMYGSVESLILYLKLILHCMLTNWNLNKNF